MYDILVLAGDIHKKEDKGIKERKDFYEKDFFIDCFFVHIQFRMCSKPCLLLQLFRLIRKLYVSAEYG